MKNKTPIKLKFPPGTTKKTREEAKRVATIALKKIPEEVYLLPPDEQEKVAYKIVERELKLRGFGCINGQPQNLGFSTESSSLTIEQAMD